MMAISAYIAGLRERIGHDLLLLPAVAVLPTDPTGRLLLIRRTDTGTWAPSAARSSPTSHLRRPPHARSSKRPVVVELGAVRAVLGRPEFRARYPNGDQVAVISIVYDARIISGTPHPDHDETDDIRWFAPLDLPVAVMSPFTTASYPSRDLRTTARTTQTHRLLRTSTNYASIRPSQ
jgi:8-oxo-dGTP pyrophosphatase MutT (NUDIX family)